MKQEDIDKTNKIIKILKKIQDAIEKSSIEYDKIDSLIRSFERKISMGDNPYKMSSQASVNSEFLDELDFHKKNEEDPFDKYYIE